jgi:cyclin A
MIKFYPSAIATSAVIIALHTLNQKCFPDSLRLLTGYTGVDLAECVSEMMRLYRDTTTSNLAAVKTKYSRSKHNRVSLLPVPQNMPTV